MCSWLVVITRPVKPVICKLVGLNKTKHGKLFLIVCHTWLLLYVHHLHSEQILMLITIHFARVV